MELLALALFVSAAIVGWWHWENHVKQIALVEFDLNSVKRVLAMEPKAIGNAILRRGSMTRAQWVEINTAQIKAIEAELQRRNVEK